MQYYFFKDTSGRWRWHLTDDSNRIIATSGESYRRKSECLRAIKILNQNFMNSIQISVEPATNSKERQRLLSAFLCHASSDKSEVRNLYRQLIANGIEPWLDEENLLPGQDWNHEIRMAVRSCDVVIVCLSRNAVSKTGFVQKEIRYALDVADEQPEGTVFLIPLRLEECETPEPFRRWA